MNHAEDDGEDRRADGDGDGQIDMVRLSHLVQLKSALRKGFEEDLEETQRSGFGLASLRSFKVAAELVKGGADEIKGRDVQNREDEQCAIPDEGRRKKMGFVRFY